MTLHNCTQKSSDHADWYEKCLEAKINYLQRRVFDLQTTQKHFFLDIRWKVPFLVFPNISLNVVSLWSYRTLISSQSSLEDTPVCVLFSTFLSVFEAIKPHVSCLTLIIVRNTVFDILPLSVCMSVETLILVYDTVRCLDISWNTHSRVWYYSVFRYQLKRSFSCMILFGV